MGASIIEGLGAPVNPFVIVFIVCVYFALWHFVIKKKLRQQPVTSFWYSVYELGFLGSFAILTFLLLALFIVIGSIQIVILYGVRMLVPLCVFWGVIGAALYFFIRYVVKKK